MHSFALPLALVDFNVGQAVLLVSVIGGMVIAITIPLAAMFLKHREQAQWHETARLALEKGQPVPPSPAASSWTAPSNSPPKPSSDLRKGLLLVGTGLGLWFFLSFPGQRPSSLRFVGAIPFFIGLALLLYAFIASRLGPKSSPPPDSRPHS